MILICTPCHTETVSVNYHQSILQLATSGLVNFDDMIRGGDSLITRQRNTMTATFLAEAQERAYSHLMWIDSDIGFTPDALVRLLEADYDICGGVYPSKVLHTPANVPAMTAQELEWLQLRYPFNVLSKDFTIPSSGFVEVRDIPCGFMLIKRSVLEAMMAWYPDLKYNENPRNCEPAALPYHYRFFDTAVIDGTYYSEDFAFCHRARAAGYSIYADLHSQLSHHGSHLYQGHVMATLVACGALDPEQLTRVIGWCS